MARRPRRSTDSADRSAAADAALGRQSGLRADLGPGVGHRSPGTQHLRRDPDPALRRQLGQQRRRSSTTAATSGPGRMEHQVGRCLDGGGRGHPPGQSVGSLAGTAGDGAADPAGSTADGRRTRRPAGDPPAPRRGQPDRGRCSLRLAGPDCGDGVPARCRRQPLDVYGVGVVGNAAAEADRHPLRGQPSSRIQVFPGLSAMSLPWASFKVIGPFSLLRFQVPVSFLPWE